MTRLTTENIKHIQTSCKEWDSYLKSKTGIGLIDNAARVSGKAVSEIEKAAADCKVYVVPITSGLGRIDGFAESVAAVINTMGFNAQVSSGCDVEGLFDARQNNADIVFMADDNMYIALNLKNGKVAENNMATARGYVELLDSCARGLESCEVLVLGYGNVGKEMARALRRKNALVTVYDNDVARLSAAEDCDCKAKDGDYEAKDGDNNANESGYKTINDIALIKNYSLICDASSEGGWLTNDMLPDNFIMVAPGVPLSLDKAAQDKHRGSFFHDTLEIGTAAMLGLVI